MIDGLVGALGVLFEWPNPLWVISGVLFGMLIGFLPGMAGSVALALLIPISFTMEPSVAILFLIGAYSPAGFGGMLTSILVNTPGSPENAATTFDGYPMAQQGRAGAAIGAATAASVIGGLIGTAILVALIPLAQRFVLAFSYPEFLMMAVLGLTVIAALTERNTYKGLLAAAVGFLVAFIGLDPITGAPRFTFGEVYLWDGIDIVPVLIGLFAGAEILALYGRNTTVSKPSQTPKLGRGTSVRALTDEPVTFGQGVWCAFRRKYLILRASVIGTGIGVVPGVGGAVSGFLAYSHAKQSSREPEKFGHGSVDGVIAAEAANDAKEGGSLLPTVAFGIPGTVGMAVLLGALIMHGVPAGPTLMIEHADLVYTLVIGMVAAKFVAPVVVWLVAGQAGRLTSLRPGVFTPIIAVAALVGTYTVRLDMLDVAVALFFGYIGYAMRRYGFSRVALIIALVLGELVERSYYQMTATFGSPAAVFTRPISGMLTALAAAVLGHALWRGWRRYRAAQQGDGGTATDEEEVAAARLQPGRLAFDAILLGFVVTIVVSAFSIETQAATMPLLIGVPLAAALLLQAVIDLVRPSRGRPSSVTRAKRWRRVSVGADGSASGGRRGDASDGDAPAADESKVGVRAAEERLVLRRQASFGAWVVAFVGLGWLAGFSAAIPVALLFFLRVLARESWMKTMLIAGAASLFLYLLFSTALGIPLS